MARFMVIFAALLLITGTVIAQGEDPETDLTSDTAGDSTTTTTQEPDKTTTTTPKSTTTTTTPKSTTTTTTPKSTTTTTTPDTTTTTTPDTTTTTTTTESTTTTTTESTTTTTTESTTSATTTTTPATTTPEPKPDSHIHYSVTENNVTCVMVAGQIFFNVNYSRTDNTTVISKVFVPSTGVEVNGSCNGAHGGQWISFAWDKNLVQMNFEIADKDSWTFTNLTATLDMDGDDFVNATHPGTELMLIVDYDFTPGEVSVNHSFICRSTLTTSNVTAMINTTIYDAPVTSTLENIQIQAYNKIINEKDFVDSVHCTADNTSDVVPIAVGCALAGLVVIVLIAYLVGRRRRSGAYQSV